MQTSNLSDAIWTKFQARKARGRKIIGGSCAALALIAVAAVTLWPQPAMALTDVQRALSEFDSVQWTQYEAGTIRDVGAESPATVPAFEQSVDYYVCHSALEIQKRFSPNTPWKGTVRSVVVAPVSIQGEKPERRPTWMFQYQEGPSKNLDEREIRWAVAQVKGYLNGLGTEPSKPQVIEYNGQRALKIFQESKHRTYTLHLEVVADPDTARLLHYLLEARRPSGERIFVRELRDLRYDQPAPVELSKGAR